MDLLPEGHGFLLVEFGSDDPDTCRERAQQLVARMKKLSKPPASRIYTPEESKHIWQIREAGPRAAAFAPGAPAEWEGWDDAAVAPEKLGAYLRDIRKLMDEYGYRGAFYGHFGHGCIHMRVSFDLQSETGIRNYREFVESRGRSGGQLRRIALRRTRRRPVARRAAAQDVRSRADGRVPRIQVSSGIRRTR